MTWTSDELDRIGSADELEIAGASHVPPMVAEQARATTLRLVPEDRA